MEFKVGDKVRLKKDFTEFIIKNANSVRNMLEEYDTFTVDYVDEYYNRIALKETDNWTWSGDWFEKIEEELQPIHDEIHLSYIGDTTIAIHEKVGIATRSKHDKEDRKIGILIATMRAIGFNKESVDKVVDVLFDDIKDIKDYATEELLKEIMNRVK